VGIRRRDEPAVLNTEPSRPGDHRGGDQSEGTGVQSGGLLWGYRRVVTLVVRRIFPRCAHLDTRAAAAALAVVPYDRVLFPYDAGWLILLVPKIRRNRAGLGLCFWDTTVRDDVDRLCRWPVSERSGREVRLWRWRGAAKHIGATVIVEMVMTMVVVDVFYRPCGLGPGGDPRDGTWNTSSAARVPAEPAGTVIDVCCCLRSAFGSLQKFLGPLVGRARCQKQEAALDHELPRLSARGGRLLVASNLTVSRRWSSGPSDSGSPCDSLTHPSLGHRRGARRA